MPNNIINSFAEKTGKSVKEVEKLWNKAKKIAKDEYDYDTDSDDFYKVVTGILKKMLKLNEESSIATTDTGDIAYHKTKLGTKNKSFKEFARKMMGPKNIRTKQEYIYVSDDGEARVLIKNISYDKQDDVYDILVKFVTGKEYIIKVKPNEKVFKRF